MILVISILINNYIIIVYVLYVKFDSTRINLLFVFSVPYLYIDSRKNSTAKWTLIVSATPLVYADLMKVMMARQ